MSQQEGRERSEPHLFVVTEDIDASNAWQLKPRLLEHMGQFGPELKLDLGQVNFIDSTGLGMLVSVLKEAREKEGHVSLINPNREIQRLLQITGLERVFRVQHSAFA
jgi:anti-sigma B factor antagonist